MINLELPWPPSLNSYYRVFRSRILISRSGQTYRKKIITLLQDRFASALKGRLQVTIFAHPPDRRRRDPLAIQALIFDTLRATNFFKPIHRVESCTFIICNHIPSGLIRIVIQHSEVSP